MQNSESAITDANTRPRYSGGWRAWRSWRRRQQAFLQQAALTVWPPLNRDLLIQVSAGIGHGLFLAPDATTIMRGNVLGVYVGETRPGLSEAGVALPYAWNIFSADFFIDAAKYFNALRYVNHAPRRELFLHAPPGLALANVTLNITHFKTYPVILYVAKDNILAGEQCFIDYGSGYWQDQIAALTLFNQQHQQATVEQLRPALDDLITNFTDTTTNEADLLASEEELLQHAKLQREKKLYIEAIYTQLIKQHAGLERGILIAEKQRILETLSATLI